MTVLRRGTIILPAFSRERTRDSGWWSPRICKRQNKKQTEDLNPIFPDPRFWASNLWLARFSALGRKWHHDQCYYGSVTKWPWNTEEGLRRRCCLRWPWKWEFFIREVRKFILSIWGGTQVYAREWEFKMPREWWAVGTTIRTEEDPVWNFCPFKGQLPLVNIGRGSLPHLCSWVSLWKPLLWSESGQLQVCPSAGGMIYRYAPSLQASSRCDCVKHTCTQTPT